MNKRKVPQTTLAAQLAWAIGARQLVVQLALDTIFISCKHVSKPHQHTLCRSTCRYAASCSSGVTTPIVLQDAYNQLDGDIVLAYIVLFYSTRVIGYKTGTPIKRHASVWEHNGNMPARICMLTQATSSIFGRVCAIHRRYASLCLQSHH